MTALSTPTQSINQDLARRLRDLADEVEASHVDAPAEDGVATKRRPRPRLGTDDQLSWLRPHTLPWLTSAGSQG